MTRLYDLEHTGIKLGLDRIRSALKDLSSPQDSFAAVHVAGTNGKGSTSALTAGILHASGLKVGLYTSPHILDFRERIRIDGHMVRREWIPEGLDAIWPAVEKSGMSFFEAATCLAFWIFAREKVDIAVLEVGLGGRLDATNVVAPELTMITSLSLDHQKTLGSELRDIAGEKAGIIKKGVPLVLANAHFEARQACLSIALERGASVLLDRESLAVRDVDVRLTGTRWLSRRRQSWLPEWMDGPWRISMVGAHQVENARLAQLGAALLSERGWPLTVSGVRDGLRGTLWPGRIESLLPRRPVVLDVAHNVEGARHLVRTLRRLPDKKRVRWVVGMVRGKHHREFLRILGGLGRPFHFCAPKNHRAVSSSLLAGEAEALGLPHTVHERVEDAVGEALTGCATDEICVITGSFFTLEEACRALGILPRTSLHELAEVPL
jgi:dihydrofolate synthase/folylpolyglutamate synthase